VQADPLARDWMTDRAQPIGERLSIELPAAVVARLLHQALDPAHRSPLREGSDHTASLVHERAAAAIMALDPDAELSRECRKPRLTGGHPLAAEIDEDACNAAIE
jgi:hypothetical protein